MPLIDIYFFFVACCISVYCGDMNGIIVFLHIGIAFVRTRRMKHLKEKTVASSTLSVKKKKWPRPEISGEKVVSSTFDGEKWFCPPNWWTTMTSPTFNEEQGLRPPLTEKSGSVHLVDNNDFPHLQ